MKKFLFTLVALMMAGTAFAADNYLFIEDMELTQEQAAAGLTEQVVFVKAHFDQYVSVLDCDILLPEGWELVSYTVPNAAKPYVWQYVDEEDDEGNVTSVLTKQRMAPQVFREGTHFIMATSIGAESDLCYSEDGSVCYGAPKWGVDPVEFNMLRLVVNAPAGITNTTITVVTDPSCTDDPRGNICEGGHFEKIANVTVATPVTPDLPGQIVIGTPDANGNFYVTYLTGDYEGPYTMTVTINGQTVEPNEDGTYPAVEGENNVVVTVSATGYNDKTNNATFVYTAPKPAPEPTFVWDAASFTMEAICDRAHTVKLFANGTEVSNPYTATQTYQEQQINFSAQTMPNADESGPSAVVYYSQNPVIIPALDKIPSAEAQFDTWMDDEYVYVKATGPNVVLYDENGQEVNPQPYAIPRPAYDPEGSANTYVYVTATTQEEGEQYAPTTVGYTVTVPMQDAPQPAQTPKPTITNETVATGVEVTATGEGHICLYVEDELVAEGEGSASYIIPFVENAEGEMYAVSATAQAPNMSVSDYAIAEVFVPKQPVTPTQVGAPTFNGYTEDGVTGYGVTLTPTTEGSQVMYQVYVWDDEMNDGEGGWSLVKDWTLYEGAPKEIWYEEENNKYRVVAYAFIGENQSQEVATEFVVQYVEPTGINEMNAGKTVAGVRYFNLAGQEMQEANGMTIVVTTYTDGTTSAVKVMK